MRLGRVTELCPKAPSSPRECVPDKLTGCAIQQKHCRVLAADEHAAVQRCYRALVDEVGHTNWELLQQGPKEQQAMVAHTACKDSSRSSSHQGHGSHMHA